MLRRSRGIVREQRPRTRKRLALITVVALGVGVAGHMFTYKDRMEKRALPPKTIEKTSAEIDKIGPFEKHAPLDETSMRLPSGKDGGLEKDASPSEETTDGGFDIETMEIIYIEGERVPEKIGSRKTGTKRTRTHKKPERTGKESVGISENDAHYTPAQKKRVLDNMVRSTDWIQEDWSCREVAEKIWIIDEVQKGNGSVIKRYLEGIKKQNK